ncbi:protein-(glutamine-N5) methyltransferase, release factor-specific [Pseudoalteromonas sp. NBT06-2]|uniref:peptide chain release factor N(5)-glutamine methyltransferase n=1 Tax=Pseudoalteromonas sp. NBT06-2 TaxID=2025950 RepID=UPI000BA715CD|nr:peptide chain release factor N(5)-glutamine methyltransferase [Pseudoalteromonas sp. NBT06-2]PAJ74407.1 protein-(glutamine-N5) methyltransferase, release factor-specific [Pseudoalteromonas sp. NBT06-2]
MAAAVSAFLALPEDNKSDTVKLDAEVLLLACIDKTRTYIFTWPEKKLSQEQQKRFFEMVQRRKLGEPIAHIVGFREFWSLPLEVNAQTLIPRPDTETLVEQVLALEITNDISLLDLGTGTGAIALAIASEYPNWNITGCDRIQAAIELAERNRQRLNNDNQFSKVQFIKSNWFSALKNKKYDVIVSNPPYIEPNDPHLNQGDVCFEPLSALVAQDDGMADLKHIIMQARSHLNENGVLLLEHGYNQSQQVSDFLIQMSYKGIKTFTDLSGNDRITVSQFGTE